MKKETPTVQAHIDLLRIALEEIRKHATELQAIGRITDEQQAIILVALSKFGIIIGNILNPETKSYYTNPDSIKDAYRELWEAVENGTVEDKFFELRGKARKLLHSEKAGVR